MLFSRLGLEIAESGLMKFVEQKYQVPIPPEELPLEEGERIRERAKRFSERALPAVEWIDETIEALRCARGSFRALRGLHEPPGIVKTSR